MKLGLSTYSIDGVIASGQMTLPGAIDWIAAQGGQCVELVPFAYSFLDGAGQIDQGMIRSAVRAAKDAGIEIANYSVLADLLKEDAAAYEAEIERVKLHVRIAAELGAPRMRHDISAFRRPRGENGVQHFEKLFGRMREAALRITEYAKGLGVVTLLENHGFFVNGCDRCERLLRAVNSDNYRMLLDTGNIACVDEDPAAAALRLSPMAEIIHLKDFYIRKRDPGDSTDFDCGGHWFRSGAGRYLRGAIMGQGDLDMWEILSAINRSGYDGCIAIEFEGLEEPKYASRVSLDNARRIWDAV